MAIGLAHRKETGERIQTFVRRLIREHGQAHGSERFPLEQLTLESDDSEAAGSATAEDWPELH